MWRAWRSRPATRGSRSRNNVPGRFPGPGNAGDPAGFPWRTRTAHSTGGGRRPRAFWQVPCVAGPPGDLTGGVLEAVSASLASGRGALVLFPTIRGMEAGAARLERLLGQGCVARLSWELSRGLRYENYLACSRGRARVVVGTQSAVFVPLPDPGLIVVVDDGNEGHCFERFPRPHVRSVAMIRAVQDGCALLLASHARSCEAQGLIERQWLRELALPSREMRRIGPAFRSVPETQQSNPGGTRLRLPRQAFEHLRTRLASGPVLVSVARAGHSSGLRCERCRARATCPRCSGPLLRPSRDSCSAVCADTPRSGSSAPAATPPGCVPRSRVRNAPRRNWEGPSPGCG